jgi:hypothetical protein
VWNVFNALVERRPKLVIRQTGDSITDRAHTRPDGRVIYMLRVAITNESTKKPVVLANFQLLLPWNDEYLDLLPDPKEVDKDEYIIPGPTNTMLRYERDMILNHRVNAQGKLGPGDIMNGALLFNGMEPIPDDIPHGSEIDVNLRVLLHHGRSFDTKCRMFIDKGFEGRFVQPSGEDLLAG